MIVQDVRICDFCGESARWTKLLADGSHLCRACEVCTFFESYLTLTADFAGQPFSLMPWTREVLRDVFGTLDSRGLRQFKDVYLEVPSKNTKTTLCAGLALYFLVASRTSGQEVYSAATTKSQASIVYRAAVQMVNAQPALKDALRIVPSQKRIIRRDDETIFYQALSADGDLNDGIQPSFVIRDELHRWRTRKQLELANVLTSKGVARREYLLWDITTAGDPDESPLCWRRHEYTERILAGDIEDPAFYGRIWAADAKRIKAEPDYWTSREARVEANPSHEDNGGYLRDETLAGLCLKAQNDPAAKSEYLRYHLNVWGQNADRTIDIDAWQACGGGVDLREWPEYDLDLIISRWGLVDRPCWIGVDAAWANDLAALVCLFPPFEDVRQWTILPFFWLPQGRLAERERVDHQPYKLWARRGFLTATEGNINDLRSIRDRIEWARQMFELRDVCYDPWNFKHVASDLIDAGVSCIEVRQGYQSLSAATKQLLTLYPDQLIRHGNHPIMNFCARSLSVIGDNKGNIQPAKPDYTKSSKRIDGISATVTAMAIAMVRAPKREGFLEFA